MTDRLQTSWQTVFSGAALIFVALGAGAAFVQLQIANIGYRITKVEESIEGRLEREKHDREKQDAIVFKELDGRLHLDSFNAYRKGYSEQLDLIKNRLGYIESTRPTTGELKAQVEAMTQRIDKLYMLNQSVEDWIRTRGVMYPQK